MSATTELETSAVASTTIAAAQAAAPFAAQEWLTFRLGKEEYRMDILRYDGATMTACSKSTARSSAPWSMRCPTCSSSSRTTSSHFREMTASIESSSVSGIGSLTHDGAERMLILLDTASLVASMKLGAVPIDEIASV